MNNQNSKCCCDENACCAPKQDKKQIIIDFLYLDLTVCERCQGTESSLDQAVDEVAHILNAAGYDMTVNKVNIKSKELAVKHRFLSSPTIRVNGKDVDMEIRESECKDCGDLCGDTVECRVWTYEGAEYSEPPKAMIINAILKEVYASQEGDQQPIGDYILPKNLEKFFDGTPTVK